MEHNTVTLSLDTYDSLKEYLHCLKKEITALQNDLIQAEQIEIFELRKTYSENLSLYLTEKGQKILDRAFKPFESTHEIKGDTKELKWNYAEPKPILTEKNNAEQEQIF